MEFDTVSLLLCILMISYLYAFDLFLPGGKRQPRRPTFLFIELGH